MGITGTAPLEELLAVANSYHQPEARDETATEGPNWLPAHDHLDSSEAALDHFRRSGIRLTGQPDRRQLQIMRQIRDAAKLLVNNRRAYQRASARLLTGINYQVDASGRLFSSRAGWDGWIDSLRVALVELSDHADRIKRCENDQCGWLFLDHSKNRSRQWCESSTCGNRQRVRRFRRHQEAA
jgi:predicted RNA-binding Zn ribbon-like protein